MNGTVPDSHMHKNKHTATVAVSLSLFFLCTQTHTGRGEGRASYRRRWMFLSPRPEAEVSLQLSASLVNCFCHLMKGWHVLLIYKWALHTEQTVWRLFKVGSIFLMSQFLCAVMSPYSVLKQSRRTLRNTAERWQFVNMMQKSYSPCGFGSTFKEIVSVLTEKAKLVSPQCSLRKSSGAQLSSYEYFLFVRAWWEQGTTLLGAKEKFTQASQQKSGRTMTNISLSNLSYVCLECCRCCVNGYKSTRSPQAWCQGEFCWHLNRLS